MHVTRSYSNHTYRSSNFEARNCHLEAQSVLVCKLDLKLSYEISIHPCNLCLCWSWSMHILHLAKGTDLHFYDLLYYSGLSQAVHNCDTWDTTWDTFSERPKRSHTLANITDTGTFNRLLTHCICHRVPLYHSNPIPWSPKGPRYHMHLPSNRHLTYWRHCHYSLVPRPPPFFVLRFAFSIIHGSGLYWTQTEEQKTGEAWERGYCHYTTQTLDHQATWTMGIVEQMLQPNCHSCLSKKHPRTRTPIRHYINEICLAP